MTSLPPGDDTDFEILEIIDLRETSPQPSDEPDHAPAPSLADRRRAQRAAACELLRGLLPPLDALESCVREEPDRQRLEQAVRIALRGLWDVFRPYHLVRVEGHGMPFDPRLHEAGEITPSARVPVNTVLETLRVGYLLGGELVRPAMVRVSVELHDPQGDSAADTGPGGADQDAEEVCGGIELAGGDSV